MNFCSTLTCIPFPTEELHDRTAPSLKCDVSLVTDIRGCRFHVHSNIYLLHVFTLSHRFLAYEIERIGYSSILQDDHKFITFEKGTSCPKCWQETSKLSLGFWRTVVEDVQSFKHQTWYIDAATRGNSSRLTKCCVFSFGIVLYLILLYVYTRNNSHPIKAKDVFFGKYDNMSWVSCRTLFKSSWSRIEHPICCSCVDRDAHPHVDFQHLMDEFTSFMYIYWNTLTIFVEYPYVSECIFI